MSEKISVKASSHLGEWLKSQNVTIIVSSYQTGMTFSVGCTVDGDIKVTQAHFKRSMGLAADKNGLSIGTLDGILRFNLVKGEVGQGRSWDVLLPVTNHITGVVNCHDIGRPAAGGTLFAASLFNCVGLARGDQSFTPIWQPPFIKEFVPEDRCHLNGLAMQGGRLRFVTALGSGNSRFAWRDNLSGGVVLDVKTNDIVAANLCMPHSPRIWRGALWLNESGNGSFGRLEDGKFIETLACPGYPRGLDFCDNIAAIGISKTRETSTGKLPLRDRLKKKGIEERAGVLLFDVSVGRVVHSIEFSSPVEEIYDVAFVPGSHDARLLQPGDDEVSRIYCINMPARVARQQANLSGTGKGTES